MSTSLVDEHADFDVWWGNKISTQSVNILYMYITIVCVIYSCTA